MQQFFLAIMSSKMSLEHGPTGKYYISITGYLAVLLKRIPPLQIPHLLPL